MDFFLFQKPTVEQFMKDPLLFHAAGVLESTVKTCREARNNPSKDAYLKMEQSLGSTFKLYEGTEHPDIKLGLAYLWLEKTAAHLDIIGIYALPLLDAENCIKHLSCDGLLESIAGDEEKQRLLAFIFMKVASEKSFGPDHNLRHAVAGLLSKWTGQPVSTEQARSLENVTTAIYGPAVWTLCRSDVTKDNEFPGHVYLSKMPLSINLVTQNQLTRNINVTIGIDMI